MQFIVIFDTNIVLGYNYNMKKFLLLLCVTIFLNNHAFAAVSEVSINRGHAEAIPIAINHFATLSADSENLARNIEKLINNNLRNSGIFRPISSAAFIENKKGIGHVPLFASWQQINANLLLNAEVKRLISGKMQVKFILWDAILEKELLAETLELSEKIWRRAGHKISDRIYSKMTGYGGYFDSRIVYVAESGPYLNRVKRLAIMDQDGENHQYLTDGKDLVLTPRFSPDGRQVIYLSYKNRIPQVHVLNLENGVSSLLGNFPGMSFAPRFSPDGTKAIMSISKDGITHIYDLELKSKKKKQLTHAGRINTSPSYSPDGKEVVFNSDSDGRRQLYIMNSDGGNVRRISFDNGVYAEPNWSSNNYIAFTRINRTYGFTIGVIRPDASEQQNTERLIASGYLVESPSWTPNGRLIVYTKGTSPKGKYTKGLNRIYTIDFTGYNERLIPTPGDASDPDWSPLRQ